MWWGLWEQLPSCLTHTHTHIPIPTDMHTHICAHAHRHIVCYKGSGWGKPLICRLLSQAQKHAHAHTHSVSPAVFHTQTHTHTLMHSGVISWLGGLGGPREIHSSLSLCLPLSGMLLSPGSKCLEISSHTPDGKQPQLSPQPVLLLTGFCSLDRTHSLFYKGSSPTPI